MDIVSLSLHSQTSAQSRLSSDRLQTPQTDKALQELKRCFTSGPILTISDPKIQFVVEVDVSDVDVCVVLSQHCPHDHKMHSSAFFSTKLTPVERNYDQIMIGNRELLAVNLALQEWRH